MWKIQNKTSDVAEIYISGVIVDDEEGSFMEEFFGDSTGYEFPKKFREQLNEVKDKDLEIHINSNGGSIFAGLAMANFVANHKKKKVAYVDGICASIATQIFFSADICKMPTNSYLVVHKPFCETIGNADEMRKAAETLDVLQEGLETVYQKKALSGTTADAIHEMVESETWLTGNDAAKFFSIEVINPLKAVDCVGDYTRYKNKPKEINFQGNAKKTALPFSVEQQKASIEIALALSKGAII